MPVILPALIKLNWQDYFAGAAMAGVNCVIGEGAVSKDPNAVIENGKIVKFDKLNEMLDAFRKFYRGYGQIIPQVNVEDDALGLPEYALTQCGAEAIEFKFGQSAKGTQPANYIATLEEALEKQRIGKVVYPDPSDPAVQEAHKKGASPNFFSYDRLPMWDRNESAAAHRGIARARPEERVFQNGWLRRGGYGARAAIGGTLRCGSRYL